MNTCATCEYYRWIGGKCNCVSECVDMDMYIGVNWTDDEKHLAYQNRYPNL